jgi:hypothetical protein
VLDLDRGDREAADVVHEARVHTKDSEGRLRAGDLAGVGREALHADQVVHVEPEGESRVVVGAKGSGAGEVDAAEERRLGTELGEARCRSDLDQLVTPHVARLVRILPEQLAHVAHQSLGEP